MATNNIDTKCRTCNGNPKTTETECASCGLHHEYLLAQMAETTTEEEAEEQRAT